MSRFQRIAALVIVVLLTAGILGAGRLVTSEDPLQHADAIYVLGGSWVQRSLEAADLYKEGYAPHIVISRGLTEDGEFELARRGIHVTGPAELGRNIMVDALKIPQRAVDLLPDEVDNTAQEADAIKGVAAARHWQRIIFITAPASTRRAGFAMRRALSPGVEVVIRAPRVDRFPVSGWWRQRAHFRTVFYEFPKLVAYWFGLKG